MLPAFRAQITLVPSDQSVQGITHLVLLDRIYVHRDLRPTWSWSSVRTLLLSIQLFGCVQCYWTSRHTYRILSASNFTTARPWLMCLSFVFVFGKKSAGLLISWIMLSSQTYHYWSWLPCKYMYNLESSSHGMHRRSHPGLWSRRDWWMYAHCSIAICQW